MLKKFLYILITMCQLLFFAGTYVLRYYTKRKLGMNRWLMYHNMQWEKLIPIIPFRSIVICFIIVITSVVIYKLIEEKKTMIKGKNFLMMGLVIIAIVTILYTACFSFKTDKPYYLNTVLLIIIYVLQVLKLYFLKLEKEQ